MIPLDPPNPCLINRKEVLDIVGAIDTLQDVGLIGDEQADVIFQEFLDVNDLSLKQYYRIVDVDHHGIFQLD